MRKIILLFGLLLLSTFVYAADCQIAHPKYGVLTCKGSTPPTYSYPVYSFDQQTNKSYLSVSCVSNCWFESKASLKDPDGVPFSQPSGHSFCGSGLSLWFNVYKGDLSNRMYYRTPNGESGQENFPINFDSKTPLIVTAECCNILGTCYPLRSDASLEIKSTEIWLYDHDIRHTSPVRVEESVGCIPNSWVQEHSSLNLASGSLPSSYYIVGENQESKPSDYKTNQEIQSTLNSLPENLRAGETYSYLGGWEIIPQIGVIQGKDGSPTGYCGGGLGNRKLYSYSEITTAGGACYLIPTSVQKQVECCNNEDCRWSNTRNVCDPNSFTCTDKRPCNTDLECSPEGQAICRNKIETMWSCNLSQPWGSNKGTCSYTEKTVPCCADNDCQADQYCNREEGCKNRVTILNCPFGNCCTEGGDYKLQDCGSGLECCTATGATVGECKASCAPPPVLPNVPTTGLPTTGPGTTYPSAPAAPNLLLPVIVIVLLGAAGAGVYYFYYLKPKQVTPIPNKTTPTAGAVCGKCNVPIKKGAKFCAGCGNKL